jgi:phenylacetate-coenzyme A ligase PaaK-like adenylate-forming protein
MDAMAVHVERRVDATPTSAAAVGTQLVGLIKNTIGVRTEISAKEPYTIERSLTGKVRRIIDEPSRHPLTSVTINPHTG